ncbi:hypothetical protein NW762_004441 [Fusarium torreyae]|uniref:Uncharacterized protein n=1 Tax=Fusarium torreyae TaxID=1237075 RepID=A0A9W8S626_9HYPO|nr:hypothetical protein NW762_004441 [Fusarium torreyae]
MSGLLKKSCFKDICGPFTHPYAAAIKEQCKTSQGAGIPAQNVWELDHTQFELSNPAWPSCLDRIIGDITKELGASNVLLRLQNLTLQGPGPIVQQNKGSDQNHNTIGTLLICLPSEHQGGNIHLSLGDRVLSFNTATSSVLDLSVIGWFSDSNCQVKELASGYRLTITYSLYQTTPLRPAAGSNSVRGGRVAELLRLWPPQYSKILYKLDDKQEVGPLSLRELTDRDLAVGQILNDVCPEVGLYMLFAEVTHEVLDDVGEKSISSSTIEGVYTPNGHPLTAKKALDPEKEVLGFDEMILGDRDFDSDDENQVPLSEVMEEREIIGRYHDIAIILLRKEELLNMVRLGDHNPAWQQRQVPHTDETYDLGMGGVVDMVVQDLEKFPCDPKAITVAATIMNKLSPFENAVKGPFIGRIANWSLASGNMLLYQRGLQVATTPVAGVLAEYLAKKFDGKEDAIEWKEWYELLGVKMQILRILG